MRNARGVAALAIILAAVTIHAAPKIRFEPSAVIAEKVTPGAVTTWLAVTHEPQPYHTRVREHARMITDQDGDGEPGGGKVRVKPPQGAQDYSPEPLERGVGEILVLLSLQ